MKKACLIFETVIVDTYKKHILTKNPSREFALLLGGRLASLRTNFRSLTGSRLSTLFPQDTEQLFDNQKHSYWYTCDLYFLRNYN